MSIQKQLVSLGIATLGSGALLQLAALPAQAGDSPYTATGWVIGVPVPGIWCTNAAGQVGIRGNTHLARVESSEPRLTGRRTILVNGAAQADGSTLMYGAAYCEVGTWDATGTNFTATSGMWDTTYRGTMGADGSLLLHIVGTGWGGAIDGWRLDETLTRAPGPILDPAIPYNYTGTIQPPPLSTNLLLDDFSGPPVGWTLYGPTGSPGSYSYTPTNGQLVVNAYWPGVVTRGVVDSYTIGGPFTPQWSVTDGQTVESRVELVSLNASASAADLVLGGLGGFYAIYKGHDSMWIRKWSPNLPWGPVIVFSYEKVRVPDTNVILSLSLTKSNANVVVTARLLAKGNSATVLYERSVVDTPGADPALTSAEFLHLSGMNLALHPDLAGAPFTTTAGAAIGLFQYNYDGQQPVATATFDNLELRKYEIPPLGIAQAVTLTWPDLGSYSIESAPSVQGPWLPLTDAVPPEMKQMTVPVTSPAQFFRLVQAP